MNRIGTLVIEDSKRVNGFLNNCFSVLTDLTNLTNVKEEDSRALVKDNIRQLEKLFRVVQYVRVEYINNCNVYKEGGRDVNNSFLTTYRDRLEINSIVSDCAKFWALKGVDFKDFTSYELLEFLDFFTITHVHVCYKNSYYHGTCSKSVKSLLLDKAILGTGKLGDSAKNKNARIVSFVKQMNREVIDSYYQLDLEDNTCSNEEFLNFLKNATYEEDSNVSLLFNIFLPNCKKVERDIAFTHQQDKALFKKITEKIYS